MDSWGFGRQFYVMAKPVGAACNMRCNYCYYLDKEAGGAGQMSDEVLELFIRQYIEAQTTPQVLFTWHGGEPMLRDLDFYRKVLRLQKQYARGKTVDNVIQTNGTFLTVEWADFLHDNGFLVGISVDGPREFHDEFRRAKNGDSSFSRVMAGIELLKEHDVMWNAMCVVNEKNIFHPKELYRFFKSIGARYIQFSPLFLPDNIEVREIIANNWGNFLCGVFDEWVKEDVGEYFVGIFDATLSGWMDVEPGTCCFSPTCGRVAVLEYNGDLYSCDHFVDARHRLGNIREKTILEMMMSREQQRFGMSKFSALPNECQVCKYLFLCNGECPKNRILDSENLRWNGRNYLCKGYRQYFEHTEDFFQSLANENYGKMKFRQLYSFFGSKLFLT